MTAQQTSEQAAATRDAAAAASGPAGSTDTAVAAGWRHPRPSSRRGRAALRRRAALGTEDRSAAGELPAARGPRDRRRRRGPRRLRRRRAGVLVAMGLLAAAGVALVLGAVSLVRDSTAGRYVEPTASPDEPGYQAYVEPTPTLAVVQPGGGSLVGITLLSLNAGDEGGAAVLVPPSTVVPFEGAETTLADAYGRGGVEAAVGALEEMLVVDIAESVVVDDRRWASLVAPVAPVTVEPRGAVDGFPGGEVELAAGDVGRYLAALGDDETELDRLERAAGFWSSWVAAVGAGGDHAVPGEVEVGIGRFVRGFAAGDLTTAPLPVTEERDDGDVRWRPDRERTADVVSRTIPFPVSPAPGARVRVRLLNGTTDDTLTTAAARRLVRSGAEITIVGNGPSFSEATTRVIHRLPGQREAAERLGLALGVGDVEQVDAPRGGLAVPDEELDVTVILGADARDRIEGQET